MLSDILRVTSALAAMVLVVLFLLMIVRAPGGYLHTRLGLHLRRLFRPLVEQRGDVPAGDGGDGDGGGEGDGAGDGSGDDGDAGNASLLADAQAAITALKAAGTEVPAALAKAVGELEQARKDAARYRGERNGTSVQVTALQEQMGKIAKHLGLDDDADPAAIAEALKGERDTLAQENRTLKITHALTKAARTKGADADALTDSRSFMTEIDKLDPSDDGFPAALEAAVDKAVKDNPKLKAPAARSGNEFNGGGDTASRPKTLEDAVAARYAG